MCWFELLPGHEVVICAVALGGHDLVGDIGLDDLARDVAQAQVVVAGVAARSIERGVHAAIPLLGMTPVTTAGVDQPRMGSAPAAMSTLTEVAASTAMTSPSSCMGVGFTVVKR